MFFTLCILGVVRGVWAQEPVPKDTIRTPVTQQAKELVKNLADSVVQKKGDIETTIQYSARDSINSSVDGQMIWLYGAAKIIYGTIELEAEEITIDYANSTLTAHGIRDSLGRRVGYPIFKNGPELYETKDITYNFKTGRARISEVVTQQGEGYLHGDMVFKNEKDELLSLHNRYTTCNLEHPHFEIISTKTKAIPNDKIVSGPFYMRFNDIPLYPLGFLFGMFPAQQESASGILFPSFGEDRTRGFNLRGLGYFLDANEYVKVGVRADLYSKGDYVLYLDAPYNWRYHFTGGFNFSFSKTNSSTQIENPQFTNDFSVRWNHSPQTKGTGRFSASVSAASSTYNSNNNLNFGAPQSINSSAFNNTSRKMNSNISYNKTFKGTPFSMGINLSHNQDLVTQQVDLTAPNLTLNMRNLYPFQRKDGTPTKLDNFSLGYSMAATNRISNNLGRVGSDPQKDSIAPFTMSNLSTFIENGRNGIRHSIPIAYSFKAFRYFTVSPSISYEEKWYFEKLNWEYDIINNRPTLVASDTIRGFNRIANYNFSAGFNTRIYGTYFFKKGNVKAIRHVVNPNISFGYTPDFTKYDDYFQAINQNDKIIYQSRHQGFVYGGSTPGKSGSIGIGLGNTLEMKVKSEKDTVARKVNLLNSLSLGTSYNIIADSFNLAPISISANTNILDNLINININSVLDPYSYVNVLDQDGNPVKNPNGSIQERRINQLAWKGGKLGRIVSANLAMGSNLNPKAREQNQQTRERIANSNMTEQDKQYFLASPENYIDFSIPWSLQLNYSLSFSRPINSDINISQSLQFSGDMSLSEKWKITFNSGFDFENMEFTTTNVGITRDLHCWTLNFDWGPFGKFTYYNFRIAVKASVLQDLKIDRRKPFYDNIR
ncbi:MAG: LPS-assembly protein LptD [Cyclobacteriaceae bacterium]|nr:LPS-assembly protein LptD [Cyclobacteriaceae bacterium]